MTPSTGIQRTPRPLQRAAHFTALFCFLFHSLALAPASIAYAQSPSQETGRAENLFYEGRFEEALQIVDSVISRSGLSGNDLRDAHALKARCEAELGNRTNAINSFCQVVVIDPSWRPDPDFYTADEIELFEQARGRCEQQAPASAGGGGKPWYLKPLTWIAGGAAIGLAAVLAGGGGGGGDGGGGGNGNGELPDFPPPPQ